MRTKLLDDTLKYLPILGLILIIAGNVKLLIYYKEFNLEIFPFIGLDEIFILFMQNSLAYLIMLIASALSLIIFKLNDGEDLPNTIRKRLARYLFNKKLFVLLILFSFALLTYHGLRPNPNSLEIGILIGAFIFVVYFIPIIIQETYLKLKLDDGALSTIFIIVIFLSLTTFSVASALNESAKVKLGYYKKVEIVFENSTFKSNPKCFYIGQTQNYVFTYDLATNSTTSYQMGKVQAIKF
jgi:hypothetical protein